MELVYLWVEEYKNIHRQGFNFSPRFRCDYNLDTNELTIDEIQDCIPDFFGENINVTAIVGKNGSGKSSVLELISFLRFERIRKITDKKVILVYYSENTLYIFCDVYEFMHDFKCDIKVTNKTKYKITKNNIHSENLFELTMFTNGLYDFTMQDEDYYILRTQHFYSFYNGDHIHYKERQDDKSRHYELNAKYAYLIKEKDSFFDFLDEIFLFDKMYLEIDSKRKQELFLDYDDEYIEKYKEINNLYNIDFGIESSWSSDEINNIKEKDKKTEVIYKFMSFYFLKEYIHVVRRFEHDLNKEFKEFFLKEFLNMISKLFDKQENRKEKTTIYLAIVILIKEYFAELKKIIEKIFKEKQGMLDDFKQNANLLKYITKYSVLVNILEKNFTLENFDSHKKNFNLISKNLSIDYNLLRKYEKHIEKSSLLFDLYNANIIRWEFFNKNKNYNYRKLSTGEKQLLEFIVDFSYTIKNMKHTKKSVIFIEEIEISLHPVWQKKLLNIIISILKKLDLYNHNSLNYSLIFTTHSPFLLSDIPKQNIIFLDKDENGNCKVVDGLHDKQETFGQNIHTLLSDSFFMGDGLMGEFAKSKINEIIDFHKEVEKIKDNIEAKESLRIEYEKEEEGKPSIKMRFWNTQSIIGDAYLKQVIKNHLVDIETILLGKDRAKREEIKRLRDEADRLEKLS